MRQEFTVCQIKSHFSIVCRFSLFLLNKNVAMEEWFHNCNDKDEVNVSRGEISKNLSALQKFFPRSDHTNGYSIPKMHGMTKMQPYIKLFGSGMNFIVVLVRQHTRHS